jgi:hypothetical protein
MLLSCFVLGITIYQLYISGDQCYSDIQLWNVNHFKDAINRPFVVRPAPAIGMIIRYSVIYIISICMIVLLTFFLQAKLLFVTHEPSLLPTTTSVFHHPIFRMTQSCFIPIIVLYYYKNVALRSVVTKYDIMSCIPKSWLTMKGGEQHDTELYITTSSGVQQQFPVVLIFFVVATISVYFMQQQRKQLLQSRNAIVTLQMKLQQKQLQTTQPSTAPITDSESNQNTKATTTATTDYTKSKTA